MDALMALTGTGLALPRPLWAMKRPESTSAPKDTLVAIMFGEYYYEIIWKHRTDIKSLDLLVTGL